MAKVETERFFGKKGIIIMIRDGNKIVSAIFKDKKNADKFNRNKPADVKKLLQLAKKTKYPKAIDESVNEAKSMDMKKRLKVYDKLKKGDKVTIKYGTSMRSGIENQFVVSKGKTKVGKERVERISLKNIKNPSGVKYYLYQRNRNVTMAQGDMAANIEDMHESINEASKEAMGIAGFTGARGIAIDNFIKKHNIDARKLFNYVKKGNLKDRMSFITALVGKPNNKFFKMIVGRFAESINEVLVIVDKFDKKRQDYGKIYYQDGGNRPGDGDIKKANKELAKLSKKHKGLTLVSVGRNSKMYDVNNPRESVNEDAPCWDTHKQVGMKSKGGKQVPNCVPKNEIKEDKNQIVQLKKKVGKSEIKFYDALSKIEKKLGKKKYRAFLEKGLTDFKINAKHYDYRSNGDAEEKLFNLAK